MKKRKNKYYRTVIKSIYINELKTPCINNYYIFFNDKIRHKKQGFKTPLNYKEIK